MQLFPGQVLKGGSGDCASPGSKPSGKPEQDGRFAQVLSGSRNAQGQAGQTETGSGVMEQKLDAEGRTAVLDFLKEQGLPEELLQDVQTFLDQNRDLSFGQILAQIAAMLENTTDAQEPAPADQERLRLFLDKCGLDSKEIDAALAALEQGDRAGFLENLETALSQQQGSFRVSSQDLKALTRAVGMDFKEIDVALAALEQGDRAGFLENLEAVLSQQQGSFRVSSQDLKALTRAVGMDFKSFEITDGQGGQVKLQNVNQLGSEEMHKLVQLLGQKIETSSQDPKAMLAGRERSPAQGTQHKAHQGEEVAQLINQLRQILNQHGQQVGEAEHQQAGQAAAGVRADSGQNHFKDQGLESGLKDLLASRGDQEHSGAGTAFGQEGQAGGSEEGEQNPWKSLLDKLEHVQGKQGAEGKSGDFSLTRAEHNLKSLADKAETAKELLQRPNIRQAVVDQVKGGMLKNLGQGRSELTLQLNPPDLGKMSLVLQVQNKDVLGLIKTNNPEVARFIQQNLHTIQQGLEQQGLKVSKLDVQTQLAQEDSSQWFGQEGHNQAREHRQQMEHRGWLKRWQDGEWLDPEIMDDTGSESLRTLSRAGLSVLA